MRERIFLGQSPAGTGKNRRYLLWTFLQDPFFTFPLLGAQTREESYLSPVSPSQRPLSVSGLTEKLVRDKGLSSSVDFPSDGISGPGYDPYYYLFFPRRFYSPPTTETNISSRSFTPDSDLTLYPDELHLTRGRVFFVESGVNWSV